MALYKEQQTCVMPIQTASYSTQRSHHQQLVIRIHRYANVNCYNSIPHNNTINNSNNTLMTKTTNKNNITPSINNFYHSNTFSQSNGTVTHIDNNITNNNSYDHFQAINIKNDNCYIDGSKHGSISCLCNTNLNDINDNNNGRSNSITINNTNNNIKNFDTKLTQVNDNGNVQLLYHSTQCDGIQSNNDNATLLQIALLKLKVAAVGKQIQSGNNNIDNISINNSSQRICNNTDDRTNETNVTNSEIQVVNTNNDISTNQDYNSTNNYNNNSNIVNSLMNCLPNNVHE